MTFRKTFAALASFAAPAAVLAAVPEISGVSVTQPGTNNGRLVHVSYSLSGADAIVTADVTTNGVSVGGRFATTEGDVNRMVRAGAGRTFTWNVRNDWPNQQVEIVVKLRAWLPGAAPDYMVADLLGGGARRFYDTADDVPLGVTNDVYKTDKMLFRRIPAAGVTWRMGQPATGEKCDGNIGSVVTSVLTDNETPHLVAFTNDFYIGVFEVTQRQYYNVMGTFPSEFKRGSVADRYEESKCRPVECVSYHELRGASADWPSGGHSVAEGSAILAFRERTGIVSLDLPTEAQWEFACRAGTTSALNSGKECLRPATGSLDENLDELGWYYGNANSSSPNAPAYTGTRDVGLKKPNAWGLYDMHGNVNEFCLDWLSAGDDWRATFVSDWATGGVTIDPCGAASGTTRVVRGGEYFYASAWARSATRSAQRPAPDAKSQHNGFRLACGGTLE